MIEIQRTPEPTVLARNKTRWQTKYRMAIAAYNANQSTDNLRISHVGYGHIEHYKPKSKYPADCFEWENLLLGCEICNGSQYKGDKFPLAHEGGPFINPCDENPDDFFEFEFDRATGTANVIPQNRRADTTERELGLNRPDLVKHRSNVVRKLAYVALRARDGDADALAELQRCMENDQEYAAFARALSKRFHLS